MSRLSLLLKIVPAGAIALVATTVGLTACGGTNAIYTPAPTITPVPFSPAAPIAPRFAATPTGVPQPPNPPVAAPTTPPPPPQPSTVALQIESVRDDLKFNSDRLTVSRNSQVRLTFKNNASSAALQHDWVLVKQGTEDAVANAGLAAGPGNSWIPKGDPNVIAATPLTDGGKSSQVTFTVGTGGTYAFICTFPGHAGTMRGVFTVQ